MGDKTDLCLSCGRYTQEQERRNLTYHRSCYDAILDEEDRLLKILFYARKVVEGYKALGGNYYSHRLGCECGGTPDGGKNYCKKFTNDIKELTLLVEEGNDQL